MVWVFVWICEGFVDMGDWVVGGKASDRATKPKLSEMTSSFIRFPSKSATVDR